MLITCRIDEGKFCVDWRELTRCVVILNHFSLVHRFAVEVADFNFGETASIDMEYKTFRQRLVDSVRDLFGRRNDHGSNSSLEYGPMT